MHKKAYLLLRAYFIDETDTQLLHPVLVSTLGGKTEGKTKLGTADGTGKKITQRLRKCHLLRPHLAHFFQKQKREVNFTEYEHFHLTEVLCTLSLVKKQRKL